MTTIEMDSLRRRLDNEQVNRFAEISAAVSRLQASFEESLRNGAMIQANQAAMLERIAAFNEKFLEHDEKEGADRANFYEFMDMARRQNSEHATLIAKLQSEISALWKWNTWLVGMFTAAIASLMTWIVSHPELIAQVLK